MAQPVTRERVIIYDFAESIFQMLGGYFILPIPDQLSTSLIEKITANLSVLIDFAQTQELTNSDFEHLLKISTVSYQHEVLALTIHSNARYSQAHAYHILQYSKSFIQTCIEYIMELYATELPSYNTYRQSAVNMLLCIDSINEQVANGKSKKD